MIDDSSDLTIENEQTQMPRRHFLQLLAASSVAAVSFPNVSFAATSTPQNLAWTSVPTGLPINSALLSAAKSLLKSLYTFTAGAADYLPTSYTNFSSTNTQYVVHNSNPSHVYWPATSGNQITWTSSPATLPNVKAGWGATVTQAGVSSPPVQTAAACFTDCSGFITSLFTAVNQQSPTTFVNWQAGKSIPEAGCFDPATGLTPNPANYYTYFKNASNGFKSVSLANIQPGDLLAFASGDIAAGDSGHIMLIAAVAPVTIGQSYLAPDGTTINIWAPVTTGTTKSTTATQLTLAVVFDETATIHSFDSRSSSGGVGAGIVLLYMDSSQTNQLQFGWSYNAKAQLATHTNSAVALGRAS